MSEKAKDILIGVLLVIIILLIVLIMLVKFEVVKINKGASDDDNSVVDKTDNAVDDANQDVNHINTNWINYLLSCEITDVSLYRMRSIDLGDSVDMDESKTLTTSNLEAILHELEDSKLIKTYSLGRGGADRDHLTVVYKVNDNSYKFEIVAGSIVVDNLDDEIKKILEENNYEEKNTNYKDEDGSFYYYAIDNYFDDIFDKYFDM